MKKKNPSNNDRQHGTVESGSPEWRVAAVNGGRKCHTEKIVYPGDPQALVGETGKCLCKTRRRFDGDMSTAKRGIARRAT